MITAVAVLALLYACDAAAALAVDDAAPILGWICAKQTAANLDLFPRGWCEPDSDVCAWKGVTCLSGKRVVGVDIMNVPLAAEIDAAFLAPGVERLVMRNCGLSGELLDALPGVTVLDVADNALVGRLPNDFFKALMNVDVSNNRLTDVGNMCDADMLHAVRAGNNALASDLTACADRNAAFTAYLQTFDVRGNQLTGTAPMSAKARTFNIAGNAFSGVADPRPLAFAEASSLAAIGAVNGANVDAVPRGRPSLKRCDVSGNAFADDGELPAWMAAIAEDDEDNAWIVATCGGAEQ